jgi:hypothetical protein
MCRFEPEVVLVARQSVGLQHGTVAIDIGTEENEVAVVGHEDLAIVAHYPLFLVTAQCYACHRKEIRSNAKSARVLFDKQGR